MTDGFALKSWVISLFNKASKKSNKYSTTEETVVGTWIDGKPIYRKTIQITLNRTTNYQEFDNTGIENLDFLIDIHGCSKNAHGDFTIFNSSYSTVSLYYHTASNTITIEGATGDWIVGKPIYITYEYTKTTDKATITV